LTYLKETGSEPCVGLVGATLGGGVGRYNGLHGMIVDALKSVKLVTAAGKLVTVSDRENPDLMWGLRGAGMNFGVIVEATYQVYPLTYNGAILNADFLFPINKSEAVFKYFKKMNDRVLPAELALIMQIGFNAQFGGTYMVLNAAYTGPEAKGRPLIQDLINIGPIQQNITMTTWKDQLRTAFFGLSPVGTCAKGHTHNVYGVGLKSYDVPTFNKFFADLQSLYKNTPGTQQSVFFIEAFPNQAAKRVPDERTAYPHRDVTTHLLFNYGYDDPALEDTVNAFAQKARNNFAATSGFGRLQCYVSYGHGDEGPEPLYAKRKLGQLRSLKNKWDPNGLFNFNEPLGAK